MTAHQQRISLASARPTASSTASSAGLAGTAIGDAREPAIGALAALLGDVVSRLEAASGGEPLRHVMAECNAALEGCLEAEREGRQREDRQATARDDLKRLAGQLAVADRADAVFVMRQIRRVLGRFDVRGA